MKLECLEAYKTDFGTYAKGDKFEVDEDRGALLLRDSPSAFREVGAKPTAAVSEEMASGQVAPDRRARGGRRRGS